MKVKCKCGYEWPTRSKLEYVSCPSCLQKVRIRFIEKTPHQKEQDVYIQEEKKASKVDLKRKYDWRND